MRLNWTESHLADYNKRQAKYPAKKQGKKNAKKKPMQPLVLAHDAAVAVELPWLTPLPGPWQRMHWRARRRSMDAIASAVLFSIKPVVRPLLPLAKVRVVITRHSSVEPDPDGLAFVKPILDVIQVASKRHPYGVGIVVDDSREHLSYEVKWVRAPRGNGRTTVEVFHA